MGTSPRSPPHLDGHSEATSKKTRQSTRLRRLTLRTLDQPRPTVNADPTTGRGSSPQKQKFHNYLGVVARKKIPIVHSNWKDVPESLKDLVWDYILLLDEKRKKRQEDAMLTENTPLIEDPPSPIERHVKWKMARTKRCGQMTSQAAQEISENFDTQCKGSMAHWQLVVLCPRNDVVVWFCSLHNKLDIHIKAAINNAIKTLKTTVDGINGQGTPKWIEVKSHVQSGGYECGYYVIHWMWNIVSGGLKNDWSMTITTIRKKWVAYFVKVKNIRCIKGMAKDELSDMSDVKPHLSQSHETWKQEIARSQSQVDNRKLIRLKDLSIAFCFVVVVFLFNNLGLCCSLNEEGNALLKLRQKIMSDSFGALSNWVDDEAFVDPCNWFGVECSDGRVVVSNLKDLCLGGTLAPKFVKLINIKSMVNMLQYFEENSFSGTIPEGFVELKELVVLDLGYNNFSGHLLVDLGSNISLAIILLDNNEFLVGLSPEINELRMLSECQADENQLTNGAKMSACTERVTTWYVTN
ncbi:Protein MALE DISCOVERER 2 [Glycine soja]